MKLNRIIQLLILITLGAIITGGLLFYVDRHNNAVSETHLAAGSNVEKISEKLDSEISDHHQTIRAIAGVWEVKKAVREKEKQLLEFANEALKHFQMSLNGEVMYLMDKDGTVRAASNYDEAGSFVGKNYAFRPYFQEAIKGRLGAYPALGVTTGNHGLYLSCPVYPDENGVVGGVLVFKISPDHFQEELRVDTEGLYLLTSPEGLIFMSTFKKYNAMTLWPLDKDAEEKILANRQFGEGPWEWSGFSFASREAAEHRVDGPEGSRFMVHKHPVKLLPGWNIYYLHDLDKIFESIEKPMLKTVGSIVLLVCLLFSVLSALLYRFACKEITRRQETEVELGRVFTQVEKAKREWEMTMDCVSDMVFLADENNLIVRMNKTFQRVTDKPYGAILNHNWQELLEECSLVPEVFGPDGVSAAFTNDSGHWFVAQKHHFSNEQLQKNYTVVSISDVTSMVAVNQELEQRNDEISQNRAKLQKAHDELATIIQRVADEEDFGVRFENTNIQHCWEVMQCGKQDCPCFGKDPLRCWQIAGTYCGGEVQGEFAKKMETCITCKNFELATRDPISMIGEEFNNMMHILEHKNNELQSAYQELKQAQSQILQQEKMASVGQLAAGVAHEINNPMGFIGSNLASLGKYSEKLTEFIKLQGGMLEKINDPETMAELQEVRKKLKLDFIVEDMHDLIIESLDGADRVKKIVMGLKNFSRVDQAEQQMASMNECVESTLNVVWNELKYKCTVEKDYGDIPQIMCFPQQLNQVFMNMLVNGAQAIEGQGVITIKTREEEGAVLVSFTDTGCGISPENQKRIFEPFFTTKDVGKGTGLGMSIAWDIVKKHHGEILVESEVGKGSTFTVKLPVERVESDATDTNTDS